jgi:hypothetical protein
LVSREVLQRAAPKEIPMTTLCGSSLTPPARVGNAPSAPALRNLAGCLGPQAPAVALPAAPDPARAPPPARGSAFVIPRRSGDAVGALLLLAGWILLWAYFLVGIVESAAALRRAPAPAGEPDAGRGGAAVEQRPLAPSPRPSGDVVRVRR